MENHFLFLGNVAAHLVALMSGIASFIIATIEAARKRPLSERVFWIIGAICIVASFDLAWQDEHRNAQVLINEKSSLASSYGTCRSDLKVADEQVQFFEKQTGIGLTNFNRQQTTLNTCVVALGRSNVKQPLRITVREADIPVKTTSERNGAGHPSVLVMDTNMIITPVHGTLTCNRPFTFMGTSFARGPYVGMTEDPKMIGYNKARIDIEMPAWNPDTPLIVLLVNDGELGPCEFKLD
jgi:hypothetical protein